MKNLNAFQGVRFPVVSHRLALGLILICPFLFGACLFDSGVGPNRIPSNFNLTVLQNAKNPLAGTYDMDEGKSVVGLQFAFRSMNYAWEVDSNIESFHDQTGTYPALAGAYFDLSSQPKNLRTFLDAVRAKGCVPYVTLDPKDWDEPDMALQKTFLGKILKGEFDAQLKSLAGALRDFQHPILFRYAHEMNGEWYPYGGGGDADGDGKADGPEKFIQAWRHVHDLFATEGASNLLWVFCPNAEDFPDRDWNRPFRYFPGVGYADLIFVDAYEHHDKRTTTLEQALDNFYNEMGHFLALRQSEGDSLLPAFGLGEFGTNRVEGGIKADWYLNSLDFVATDRRIKFHVLYNGQNGKEDFSLRGLGEAIKSAYQKTRFQFRLFDPLPN
ncbi:MAG: glycoside hydrolase family 26 protein [Fibrobacterota bacterium]|nr:glycoside hydrolase family 26 protein [Fibrobacterota bacterium]